MNNSMQNAFSEYNTAIEARFKAIESGIGQAYAWIPILQSVINSLPDEQKKSLAEQIRNIDKSIYPDIARQWLDGVCSIALRQTGSE